jgi:protein disulfide-isomerase
MKLLSSLGFFLLAALGASAAIKIGDSYETVLAEKGTPGGKMNVGGALLLIYPEERIKLKENKVVSIDVPKAAAIAQETSAPKPAGNGFKRAIWTTNYADALKQAKEQNRHVFVFFTGSDWCGWCMRLKEEILSTPQFQTYARDNLILVELDFPREKKLSPALIAQNNSLAEKYGIRGYPTVIILNSRGKEIDSLGYQEGGPQPFIERLRSM